MSDRYRLAGVDLERKRPLVERLAVLAGGTGSAAVLEGVGGFAGLFALREARPQLRDPVLVAGADGVGTKLKLIASLERHPVAGIDCVAMCANDVLAAGGEPLFFLDYLAMGRLDDALVAAVVEGVAEGCRRAGCILLGGETAEMPGMYGEGEYELAGFCVGVAEREELYGAAGARGVRGAGGTDASAGSGGPGGSGGAGGGGRRVQAGDLLIGLASSGIHSNGFSLVRKVVEEAGVDLEAPVPWSAGSGGTLGEALTEPTRIYAHPVLQLRRAVEVHGLAHVTGGGLPDNLGRILPAGTRAVLDGPSWVVPPVFRWLAEVGRLEPAEMFRVFNMGLGMVAAVAPGDVEAAMSALAGAGQEAFVVGEVVESPPFEGFDGAPRKGPRQVLRFGPTAKRPDAGGWTEIVLP